MVLKCPSCGCTDIEVDPSRADTVCTSCGMVLSEQNIVNEVQFQESSSGVCSAVGQFVSADAISKRPLFKGVHGTYSRESKEITYMKARKNITFLATALRLKPHLIDTAFNFYKLALSRGLTRGRKNPQVIGACVYITCRTEPTDHMLIDVSDALQIDVYELGRTYLKLSTALCIRIPLIDPCLYIIRFSHKLTFGDKTHEVSLTAQRLVQRMKTDWMHTGRRPSGLCGAALIIAARIHNFNRTLSDVLRVVKVHETTLRKRLREFGKTPSSALTLEEFMTVDLEEQQDPPAFTAARKREQVAQLEEYLKGQQNYQDEFSGLTHQIEKQLEERKLKLRGIWAKFDRQEISPDLNESVEIEVTKEFIAEETLKTIDRCLEMDHSNPDFCQQNCLGIRPSTSSLGIKETLEQCMEIRPNAPEPEDDGILDLTGIDDNEIDSYIMSSRESKFKTEIWMDVNKDYLETIRIKEENEKLEAEERERDGKPPKAKKIPRRSKAGGVANTAGEAIEKMLQEKKLSSKINYDVLRSLKGEVSQGDLKGEIKLDRPTPSPVSSLNRVEMPDEISSVMRSLTGKRPMCLNALTSGNKRVASGPQCKKEEIVLEEEENEDDDENEENDENSLSTAELLRLHRGETLQADDDEFDY